MIAAEKEEVLWVLDLVRQEEADGLEALLASVDVIAQEEIIWLGREPAVLEETKKVRVLTVDVT